MTPLLKNCSAKSLFLQKFFQLIHVWKSVFQCLWRFLGCGVCCHTHRFVVVLHYIFHKATVCFLAKDNAY